MDGKQDAGGVRPWKLVDRHGKGIAFDEVRPNGTTSGELSAEAVARLRGLLPGGVWLGDLTAVGMNQAVELGRRVRARYGGLLPLGGGERTFPDAPRTVHTAYMRGVLDRGTLAVPAGALVETQSTPMRRTIETAAGVLTGLLATTTATAAAGGGGGGAAVIRLNSDSIDQSYLVFDFKTAAQQEIYRASVAALPSVHGAAMSQLAEELEAVTGWQLPEPARGQPTDHDDPSGHDHLLQLGDGPLRAVCTGGAGQPELSCLLRACGADGPADDLQCRLAEGFIDADAAVYPHPSRVHVA